MTDDGFLNPRQAAAHVGYEFTGERDADRRALRAFYAFVKRRRVTTKRDGRRLLFRRVDLDRAVEESTDAQRTDRLEQMRELGRRHARGEALIS